MLIYRKPIFGNVINQIHAHKGKYILVTNYRPIEEEVYYHLQSFEIKTFMLSRVYTIGIDIRLEYNEDTEEYKMWTEITDDFYASINGPYMDTVPITEIDVIEYLGTVPQWTDKSFYASEVHLTLAQQSRVS